MNLYFKLIGIIINKEKKSELNYVQCTYFVHNILNFSDIIYIKGGCFNQSNLVIKGNYNVSVILKKIYKEFDFKKHISTFRQ